MWSPQGVRLVNSWLIGVRRRFGSFLRGANYQGVRGAARPRSFQSYLGHIFGLISQGGAISLQPSNIGRAAPGIGH